MYSLPTRPTHTPPRIRTHTLTHTHILTHAHWRDVCSRCLWFKRDHPTCWSNRSTLTRRKPSRNYPHNHVGTLAVLPLRVVGADNTSHGLRIDRLGRGPVISVKFSLDHRVLSIQRTSRTVVFHNLGPGLDPAEYSQSCKSKLSSHLLGFVWTGTGEVTFLPPIYPTQ